MIKASHFKNKIVKLLLNDPIIFIFRVKWAKKCGKIYDNCTYKSGKHFAEADGYEIYGGDI